METKSVELQHLTLDALRGWLQESVEVILMDGTTPVGRVLPIAPAVTKPRVPNLNAGGIIYIADDFDDPLPDEFWFGDE